MKYHFQQDNTCRTQIQKPLKGKKMNGKKWKVLYNIVQPLNSMTKDPVLLESAIHCTSKVLPDIYAILSLIFISKLVGPEYSEGFF